MKHEYIGAAVGLVGAALYSTLIWPVTLGSDVKPPAPNNDAPPGGDGASCGVFSTSAPNAPSGTACAPSLTCVSGPFSYLSGTCLNAAAKAEFEALQSRKMWEAVARRGGLAVAGAVLGYFAGGRL